MCRGGVALPRLIFVFVVGDRSPSSIPPSKLKPSTPSGEMKLGEARFVGVAADRRALHVDDLRLAVDVVDVHICVTTVGCSKLPAQR